MNYIVLEGISLYVFAVIVILLLLLAVGGILCIVLSDRQLFVFKVLLAKKDNDIKNLMKENFLLKIKSGEFDTDEE